jgi:hypothetical protein
VKKEKLQKWQRDIVQIEFEVLQLRDFRRDARVFRWMTEQYEELFEEGGLFSHHVFEGQLAYLLMAVRRLVKDHPDSHIYRRPTQRFLESLPVSEIMFPRTPESRPRP